MVEHEALVALFSSDARIGPATGRHHRVGDDDYLLAYERTARDSLEARVDDEAITERCWYLWKA